jgi:hypothetical protein
LIRRGQALECHHVPVAIGRTFSWRCPPIWQTHPFASIKSQLSLSIVLASWVDLDIPGCQSAGWMAPKILRSYYTSHWRRIRVRFACYISFLPLTNQVNSNAIFETVALEHALSTPDYVALSYECLNEAAHTGDECH